MGNSFGSIFKISTFGESHGPAVGVVIDGCPAGLEFDTGLIERDLQRRKPGQSKISTQRKEDEAFEVLSGVFEGTTTGTPISIMIRNKDHRSGDYHHLEKTYRPSHADFTYEKKYGLRDYRGGGRSSARETANWVVAGAVAKMLLVQQNISVNAFVSSIGNIETQKKYNELDLNSIEDNIVRCPDKEVADSMIQAIEEIRKDGDTLGGTVSAVIHNCPVGLGEPVFDKLHAALGHAMLTINAVKGFEYGSGFSATRMKGSEHNDVFQTDGDKVRTVTNYSGGIQGGISNGEDIFFKVAFKPVATIMKSQESIDNKGTVVELEGRGRHDPCVVPRAVPIVEAMAALVIADFLLLAKTSKI